MRIGLATIFHESNAGVRSDTGLADFAPYSVRGADIVDRMDGTKTVSGGVLEASRRRGVACWPVVHYWATPAGPLDATATAEIEASLRACLDDAPALDAFILEVHGAMVSRLITRPDAHWAALVRSLLPTIPLVVVVDPHANLAPGLVCAADAVIAYQRNPHVDMAEAGERAVAMAERLHRSTQRMYLAAIRIPVTAPAIAQGSEDEPLRTLAAAALTLRCDAVVECSLTFGFPYARVPDIGMTSMAMGWEPELVGRRALELANRTWASRAQFERELLSPAAAVAQAVESEGLSVIADTGDNVGGGAPGSSTTLLSAIVSAGRGRFAVTLCDPRAAAAIRDVPTGAQLTVALGEPPLSVRARARAHTDGAFVNAGPLARGVRYEMGPTAVIETERMVVVVHSSPVMANDQQMLLSQGVDLAEVDGVILKGATAIRAGWAAVASEFLAADTPGPTTSNLGELELGSVAEGMWPLDPDTREPGATPPLTWLRAR